MQGCDNSEHQGFGCLQIVRELKAMGQALRPPRNRPKSSAGASVSSAELDARGVPSGKPRNASPAQQLAQVLMSLKVTTLLPVPAAACFAYSISH